MKLAVLLWCLLAGPGLAQATQGADTSASNDESLSLLDGQVTLDISTLAPSARTIWVTLQAGNLPLGTVITVFRPDTSWQQNLTAFGARSDVESLSYQVAVPRGAATSELTLSIRIGGSGGGAGRPATATEVLGVTLLPAQ